MPTTATTAPPPPIHGLHHFAWRCRDSEETRRFYEDLLGLPLAHVIKSDHVPSTGEYCPYVHIFFRMRDGSFIAFFDLGDDVACEPSPNTPKWVNHISFRVDSIQALQDMMGGRLRGRDERAILAAVVPRPAWLHAHSGGDGAGAAVAVTTAEADMTPEQRAELAEYKAAVAAMHAEKVKLRNELATERCVC